MDRDFPSHSTSNDINNETLRRRRRHLLMDEPQPSTTATIAMSENVSDLKEEEEVTADVEKISIKLKFLNDEIKIDNHAHLNETVLSFKR